MSRYATILVVSAMVMIAACSAIVVYMQFQLSGLDAFLFGCVTFITLALGQILVDRGMQRRWVERRLEEVAAVASDATHEATRAANRVMGFEAEFSARVRAEIDPIATEVEVIGSLLRQIAEAVAEVDDKVERGRMMSAYAPAPQLQQQPPMGAYAPAYPEAYQLGPSFAPAQESPHMAREAMQLQPPRGSKGAVPASEPQGPGKVSARTPMERMVLEAVRADRIDIFLQPIVTLPQRKVRHYELHARLRDAQGEHVSGDVFVPIAETLGLMPRLDAFVMVRAFQIVRRLAIRNREVGLFVNLSMASLGDIKFMREMLTAAQGNADILELLTIELTQGAYKAMSPIERNALDQLREVGGRFSLDHVSDLTVDLADLTRRGVRYLKVSAESLLRREPLQAGDIHPEDLSTQLSRYGLELIADRLEREAQVVELLDFDIRLGQGFLFSVPRPVRPDVFASAKTNAAASSKSTQPPTGGGTRQVAARAAGRQDAPPLPRGPQSISGSAAQRTANGGATPRAESSDTRSPRPALRAGR